MKKIIKFTLVIFIIEILSKNGLNVENRKGYATVLK
jgi:hypothetical protein